MLNRNKIILIGLIVLLLLGGGIFWYNKKKSSVVVVQKNIINQVDAEKAKRAAELNGLNSVLDQIRLTDKDLDGLTDAEEAKLGTNPENSDTDSD